MANPFSVAVPDIYQALLAGEQGYTGMRDMQRKSAQDDARRAAQVAFESGDTRGAIAKLIGAGDATMANAASQYHNNANGVFGTPIYGTDAQGNTVLGTLDKTGNFRRAEMGGITPTPGVRMLDTGTGFVPVSSRSGQPVQGGVYQPGSQAMPGQPPAQTGYIPKDVAGEARDKKLGAEQGEKLAGMGQAKAGLDSSVNNLDRLAFEAKRIMNDPAIARITGIWGMFRSLPGGPAASLEAKLETLKSQVGFGVLQAMRDASKTGGALGQVSNIENQLLQNNLAALSQAQSADEFKKAMQQIIDYTESAKGRLRGAYDTDYGSLRQAKQPAVQGGGVLQQAKDAIARGADRAAVIKRLRENGIDATGL